MYSRQNRVFTEAEKQSWTFIGLSLVFMALRSLVDFYLDYRLSVIPPTQFKLLVFTTGFLALISPLCFVVAIYYMNKSITTDYTPSATLIDALKQSDKSSSSKRRDFVDMLKKRTGYRGPAIILYLITSDFDIYALISTIVERTRNHVPVPFVVSSDLIPENLIKQSFFVGSSAPEGTEVLSPSDLSSIYSAISMLTHEIQNPLFIFVFLESILTFNNKTQMKKFILDIMSLLKSKQKDVINFADREVLDNDVVELLKFSANFVYEYRELDREDTIEKQIRATKLPGSKYTGWLPLEEIFSTV